MSVRRRPAPARHGRPPAGGGRPPACRATGPGRRSARGGRGTSGRSCRCRRRSRAPDRLPRPLPGRSRQRRWLGSRSPAGRRGDRTAPPVRRRESANRSRESALASIRRPVCSKDGKLRSKRYGKPGAKTRATGEGGRAPIIAAMPDSYDELLATGVAAANAGSAVLRRYFRSGDLDVARKADNDFVTRADRESEAAVLGEIRRRFPGHRILAEEGGRGGGGGSEYQWLVDPLDGTTNFLQGLPVWCISVACMRGGEVVAGVVLDPPGENLD